MAEPRKNWWQKQPPVLKLAVGLLVVILLLIAVGGAYFVFSRRHGAVRTRPAAEPVAAAIPVHVTFMRPTVFQQVIVIDGHTTAGPVVDVAAPTAGTLTSLPTPGSVVRQGQPIALLKASPLPAASALQQDQQRHGAGYVTPPVSNGSRWIGSSVPRVERPVGNVTLTAPVTGEVLPSPSPPGTLMSQGQPVVKLLTLAPLSMNGLLDQMTAQRLTNLINAAPQGLTFSATLADGRLVSGSLSGLGVVTRALPKDDGTLADNLHYQLTATLDGPALWHASGRLQPDMDGRMMIPAEKVLAYKLPHRWLVRRGDGTLAAMGITSSNTMIYLPVQALADSMDGVWVAGLPGAPAVDSTGTPLTSSTTPGSLANMELAQAPGVWLITGWPVRLADGQRLQPRLAGMADLTLESDLPTSPTLAPNFGPVFPSSTAPLITQADLATSPALRLAIPVSGLLPPPFPTKAIGATQ